MGKKRKAKKNKKYKQFNPEVEIEKFYYEEIVVHEENEKVII